MATTNNALNNASSTSVASTTQSFTISNSDNTGTSAASLAISVGGGTTSGDPKTTYTVTGVTNWSQGIDNSASDAFKLSASTTLGTTDTWVMTTAGERTMPLQPAFLAQNSATDADVTGDNTTYTIICDTEIYDQGSDYDNTTGLFTAPVTGRYLFTATVFLIGLTAAHTSIIYEITASNRTARGNGYLNGTAGLLAGDLETTVSSYIDLDAGDTAYSKIRIAGSTKTIDVYGEATHLFTSFGGSLIC